MQQRQQLVYHTSAASSWHMGQFQISSALWSSLQGCGICIPICATIFWVGNIIVTYALPAMINSKRLASVFSIYSIVCFISWIFVFLKVPETKGMPLEVITEFFAVGTRQAAAVKNEWLKQFVGRFSFIFFVLYRRYRWVLKVSYKNTFA